MRGSGILVIAIGLCCSCAPQHPENARAARGRTKPSGCKVPREVKKRLPPEAPDPEDAKKFTTYLILSKKLPADTFWLYEVRGYWGRLEWQIAVKTALGYLEPRFNAVVHNRAILIVRQGELDLGFPMFRAWMKERLKSLDFEAMASNEMLDAELQMLINCAMFEAGDIPEFFELYSAMLRARGGGPRIRIGEVMWGKPALEWVACDEGARGIWRACEDVLPQAKAWERFPFSDAPGKLQGEWRRELPRWLKAHPECRSFWIQRWRQSLLKRGAKYAKYADRWPGDADSIRAAIVRFEKEFATELADRRGICGRGITGGGRGR